MSDAFKTVETYGVYKGYHFIVTINRIGLRCGYVMVPKGSKYYHRRYQDIPVKCHGGLTFTDTDVFGSKPNSGEWWIGFDCGHYGDANDVDAAKRIFGISDREAELASSIFGGMVRSNTYVQAECRRIIEQLRRLETLS